MVHSRTSLGEAVGTRSGSHSLPSIRREEERVFDLAFLLVKGSSAMSFGQARTPDAPDPSPFGVKLASL